MPSEVFLIGHGDQKLCRKHIICSLLTLRTRKQTHSENFTLAYYKTVQDFRILTMERKLYENMCYLLWDMMTYSNLKDFLSGTADPSAVQYFSFALCVLTCIIGYVGNIIVIFTTGFLMRKNKYKIWFLHLALADFIFLLFLPLHAVSELKGRWLYGSTVCKFYEFFSSLNMNAGIYILTALNIDRALSVAKPIWHLRFHSWRFCCCICAGIWVSSVLCSVPIIIYSDLYGLGEDVQCVLFVRDFNISMQLSNDYDFDFKTNLQWFESIPREFCKLLSDYLPTSVIMKFDSLWRELLYAETYVVVSLSVFGYLIPMSVILISNIIIALHVKNSRMAASSRLYRVVIIEVLSFFCTRTPYVLTYIISLIYLYAGDFTLAYKVSLMLPLLSSIFAINCCLNPVVYVLAGEQVRSEIVTFFKKTT
ncbi:chemerin-like receptor 1 [Dendropsophus ebraccatus]|uniref:chemerin-like receptor 1 n=1 Tax=Dendropsophus ebraccatus TaxID=150705 RepID=UPI0038314B0F